MNSVVRNIFGPACSKIGPTTIWIPPSIAKSTRESVTEPRYLLGEVLDCIPHPSLIGSVWHQVIGHGEERGQDN